MSSSISDPNSLSHMSTNGQATQQSSTGFDHLVEAATALTQLVRTASSSKVNQVVNSNQISDDEETKPKQSSVTVEVDKGATSPNGTKTSGGTEAVPPPPTSGAPMQTTGVSATGSSSPSTVGRPTAPSFKASENMKEIFPRRLLRILADPTISDIITWLPHGRSFVILKTDELAETVLPKYFPESCSSANSKANSGKGAKSQTCKYPSFTRKLNRWGFRQVTRGPDSGAFHHKFFVRDEPDLCLKMVCQRTIKRNKADKAGYRKHSEIRPRSHILGPYSAALRQQAIEPQTSSNNFSKPNDTFAPLVELSESDSSTGHQRKMTASAMIKHVTGIFQKRDEDQSTIISNSRSSCTSPTPNMAQMSGSINGSINSLLSPSTSNAQAGNLNGSPTSQMVRTVSTTSSLPPGGSLNTNLSFPVFSNNGTQIDPRVLLQHNFATNAYSNANSTYSSSAAPAPVSTNNSATSNMHAMPQLPQTQSMPNYITLVDAKQQSVNQPQHTGIQQNQSQQPVIANNLPQLPNNSKFNAPIVPVATLATNVSGNSSQQMATAASAVDFLKNNALPHGSGTTNFAAQQQLQQQLQQQQQQRPPQTDAEIRVANAKSMLYKAFLEAQALGQS